MFQLRDSLSSSLKIVQFHARFKVARSHFLCLLGKFLKPGNSPHSRRSAFTFHRIRSNFLSREKIHLRYPRTLFSLLSLSLSSFRIFPSLSRRERNAIPDTRHARETNPNKFAAIRLNEILAIPRDFCIFINRDEDSPSPVFLLLEFPCLLFRIVLFLTCSPRILLIFCSNNCLHFQSCNSRQSIRFQLSRKFARRT